LICPPIRHRAIRHRGVTLLEVLMVIMISAAALSIAGVSGTFRGRTDSRSDADEVLRSLRLARETAMISRCDVRVRHGLRIDPSTGRRRQSIEVAASADPYRPQVDANGVTHFGAQPAHSGWMSQPIWLAEDTSVRSDANIITFNATGGADRNIRWRIDHSGQSHSVVVTAASGEIRLDSP